MAGLLRRTLICLLCLSLLPTNVPARADTLQNDAHAIVFGIVAVSAAIVGVALYFALHHSASIKGSVASGPNGLEIRNEGDQLTYQLAGLTSAAKSGDVVRVKGKKKSAKGSAGPTFEIKTLARDYGACSAATKP